MREVLPLKTTSPWTFWRATEIVLMTGVLRICTKLDSGMLEWVKKRSYKH